MKVSEKDYKCKVEQMFQKNTVLINELEQAKEIIRDLIKLYRDYPFKSEIRLQKEWNEDEAKIKKAEAFLNKE